MNRLFFRPEQCGMTKTDAAAQTLGEQPGHTLSLPLPLSSPSLHLSLSPSLTLSLWLSPFLSLWLSYIHMLSLSLSPWRPAGINPDVSIESFTMNITTIAGFDAFKASVTHPDTGASRVDLILSCVDNYEARITINQVRRPRRRAAVRSVVVAARRAL